MIKRVLLAVALIAAVSCGGEREPERSPGAAPSVDDTVTADTVMARDTARIEP